MWPKRPVVIIKCLDFLGFLYFHQMSLFSHRYAFSYSSAPRLDILAMTIRGFPCPSQQVMRYYIRNILHGFIVFPDSSVFHKMQSYLFLDQNEINVQRSVMELLKYCYILDEKGDIRTFHLNFLCAFVSPFWNRN